MGNQYDRDVAGHYAAYRPPLHQLILARALPDEQIFNDGLDVGCGTGRSSVALLEYCRHVFAVDSSREMLDAAIPTTQSPIYRVAARKCRFPNRGIDVITFAGSLGYADMDSTAKEVIRVCRADAWIVPTTSRS